MVDRRVAILALAGLAGAMTALAGPPSPETTPASLSAAPTAAASVPRTSSVSGTIVLSSVSWGRAFADYMRVLHDKRSNVESIDAARRKFESAFGTGPTTATTKPPGPMKTKGMK